jgi:hypothetical protein
MKAAYGVPAYESCVSSPSGEAAATAERMFWRTFAGTAVLKLLLAFVFPFTGDEAYFVFWGKNLDYGYYDHGAMTGWWLWLMLQLGDAPWLMRLPALASSQVIGWLVWRMLRRRDATKAGWAAALYLVSPLNVINILTTTDTPLMFWSVLSVVCAVRAVERERESDWFLAGLCLGFAFLAKYFAVLLGLSYAVLLLGFSGRPRVRSLLVLLAGVVPGVGVNVAWNYAHGWTNVLFNLMTRHVKAGFSITPPFTLLLFIALLAGPAVVWLLMRPRESDRLPWRAAWSNLRAQRGELFLVALVVPHAVFFAVAFFHRVGVHWLLSFFVFLYPLLFHCFTAAGLRRLVRATALYSAIPLGAAFIVPIIPPEWATRHRDGVAIITSLRPEETLATLAPYRDRYLLATPSYSKSALLGFFAHTHVPIVGPGSYHGREDDIVTDLRQYDGRDIMIVTDHQKEIAQSQPWFERTEVREHELYGARFRVLLGQGFRYDVYREQVLRPVAERYYRMPAWLRPFSKRSYFLERYNLEEPAANKAT